MHKTDKSCSALNSNSHGGFCCSNGHATTLASYGNGYPKGDPMPVCLREDHVFDEETLCLSIKKWNGE